MDEDQFLRRNFMVISRHWFISNMLPLRNIEITREREKYLRDDTLHLRNADINKNKANYI